MSVARRDDWLCYLEAWQSSSRSRAVEGRGVVELQIMSSCSFCNFQHPAMSHTSSSPNDLGIWEFVTCSKCYLPFSSGPSGLPQVPFWLTECGHVICNAHLSTKSFL